MIRKWHHHNSKNLLQNWGDGGGGARGGMDTGILNNNRLCKSREKTLRDMCVNSPLEKWNIHMFKCVLGVGRKTPNIVTFGDLGRYPLYIDTVLVIIMY